jgi:hypothetical protein
MARTTNSRPIDAGPKPGELGPYGALRDALQPLGRIVPAYVGGQGINGERREPRRQAAPAFPKRSDQFSVALPVGHVGGEQLAHGLRLPGLDSPYRAGECVELRPRFLLICSAKDSALTVRTVPPDDDGASVELLQAVLADGVPAPLSHSSTASPGMRIPRIPSLKDRSLPERHKLYM